MNLNECLQYDAVAEAEKLNTSGRLITDDWSLLLSLQNSERLDKLLNKNRDTNGFRQSFNEALDIIYELGFKVIHTHPTLGTEDTFNVLWKTDESLLMTLESFCGTRVNSIKVYGFWDGGQRNLPYGCSSSPNVSGVCGFNKDSRNGLRFFLDDLRSKGNCVKQWPMQPFLWLVDYQQSKVEGYDFKAINQTVLKSLPQEVQVAVCYKETLL